MRNIEIGSDGRAIVIESAQTFDWVPAIYPDSAIEAALTAATPAVSVDCYFTELDATSNGVAATLADGKIHGQMKKVQASVVSGGAVTLTLASAASASLDVVTFTVIGDYVVLQWTDQNDDGAGYWRILELGDEDGDVDTPTVA